MASPMNCLFLGLVGIRCFHLLFVFVSPLNPLTKCNYRMLLFYTGIAPEKSETSSSVVPAIGVLVNSGRATEIEFLLGLYNFCE